jgi:hypothetical protein
MHLTLLFIHCSIYIWQEVVKYDEMDNINVNMSLSLYMQFAWSYCAFKALWSVFTHIINVQEVTALGFSPILYLR